MSEIPTPETDAFILSQDYSPTGHQWRNFTRQLERERDEAREERDWAIKQVSTLQSTFEYWQLKMLSEQAEALQKIDSEYDKLFDEAHQIRIEHDEAREELRIAVGLLSTQPQFADKHPEDVLAFVKEGAK